MLQVILCQYCARYKVFFLFFLSIFSTIYLYIYIKRLLYTNKRLAYSEEKIKN